MNTRNNEITVNNPMKNQCVAGKKYFLFFKDNHISHVHSGPYLKAICNYYYIKHAVASDVFSTYFPTSPPHTANFITLISFTFIRQESLEEIFLSTSENVVSNLQKSVFKKIMEKATINS